MSAAEDRGEWWLDHTNLAAMYQWLCDEGRLEPSDVLEVRYYLSKPWKWSAEFAEMTGARANAAADDGRCPARCALPTGHDGAHEVQP